MNLRGRNNLRDESVFFVTTTIRNFIPVFSDSSNCEILIKNILHYKERYKFDIVAYVIMPTHFHWIVVINPEYGYITYVMRDIKKYSAWDILDNIEKSAPSQMKQFTKTNKPRQKRQLWKHRFHDFVIKSEITLLDKVNYIHYNPVEAGLVDRPEDYKYSSARNYILNDHSVMAVNTQYYG